MIILFSTLGGKLAIVRLFKLMAINCDKVKNKIKDYDSDY